MVAAAVGGVSELSSMIEGQIGVEETEIRQGERLGGATETTCLKYNNRSVFHVMHHVCMKAEADAGGGGHYQTSLWIC